jgi:dCMP deaminase
MSRISREQMFMSICDVISQRSTCHRANVGTIITHKQRIVSIGYNGVPSGEDHCYGKDCPLTATGGCSRAIHAEVNALKFCPTRLTYLDLYVNLSPCTHCADAIAKDGRIKKVFFRQEYRVRDGILMLINADIEVFRVTMSGVVIDCKTNEIATYREPL